MQEMGKHKAKAFHTNSQVLTEMGSESKRLQTHNLKYKKSYH